MSVNIKVRGYDEGDLDAMIAIWNSIVEDGQAFPQEETLTYESGREFFAGQTHCGVAVDDEGNVLGLYILHPNNVGRCGHIANASYGVARGMRGRHIGAMLVEDSLKEASEHGFRILQFNAVVETNIHARHLYGRLGFKEAGMIPGGFRQKDGHYENIYVYFHEV